MRRLNAGRRRFAAGASLSLLGLTAGLGGAQAAGAAAPQRIVSVGGALTEIVCALGAEAMLAGVDTTSLFPESVRKLPSVGYARSLSAEGVLSLAPAFVLATEDAGPPTVLKQVTAAGVPVHVLAARHRFEGLLERVEKVGELIGRKAEADRLGARLRSDWTEARAQVAAEVAARAKPVRVLFVLSHSLGQVMVAGSDTSAQAMIDYAGAENAFKGVSGYKPLTPEAAIAGAPDVILVTDQGLQAAGGADGILRLPGLADTPAGRQRRGVSLEAMLLLGFGPRLPQALRQLDAALRAPRA